MTSIARSTARALLLALALGALALPAGAIAGDGGGASAPGATPVTGGPAPKAKPAHADGANGVGITTRSVAMVKERLSVSGTAPTRRTIAIERRDAKHGWTEVAQTTPRADHTFNATWRPARPGRVQLRAVVYGPEASAAAADAPTVNITVYRSAYATWYGPGEFGTETACGQILRPGTIGVAHRTLPCGTKVRILYKGRTLTVPVIDRGPYSQADWDLTQAAARSLGFDGFERIGFATVR